MNQSTESFCPKNQKEWRNWLKKNHQKEESVWLVMYKKHSELHNLTWSEAVDEALCFGWIDSTKRPIDSERFKQYFGRRKPSSTWSKINKDKVKALTKAGLIMEAGKRSIEIAKKNGNWTLLDSVERLEIPEDLEAAFAQHSGSIEFFKGMTKSMQKGMLHWVTMAKRPDTRKQRIKEIATNAAKNEKPKRFR